MTKFIIIIGSFVIVLIFGWFFVFPKYQEFSLANNEVIQNQELLKSKVEYAENLVDISEKLNNYKDQIAKINMAIPNEVSIPDLYDFFIKSSAESGLIFEEMSATGISSTEKIDAQISETGLTLENQQLTKRKITLVRKKIKETEISLEVSGPYESFKNFVSLIENSARFFKIKNISITTTTKGGIFAERNLISPTEKFITFILDLTVYSY